MIPVWMTPQVIKGGIIVTLLGVVFYGGCRTQKSMDMSKIQRISDKYERCVGIVDIQQTNIDMLRDSIERQNAAWIKLSNEGKQREDALKDAHTAAVRRLNTASGNAIRDAEEEAVRLRERMAGLSVGEACHEAMRAIVQ